MRSFAASSGILALLLGFGSSCSFDTDAPAPYVPPPVGAGACPDAEALFPKVLALVRQGKLEDLRRVVEARMSPGAEGADPSLRGVLGAMVRLVGSLGLDRAQRTAGIARSSRALRELRPVASAAMRFIGGGEEGPPRWASTEAAAELLDHCEAVEPLSALLEMVRLTSEPDQGRRWMGLVAKELSGLLRDPTFAPFLESFEQDSNRGRPAVLALLEQLWIMIADQGFTIARIRALLESTVFPAVNEALRQRIDRLIDLLAMATADPAGLLPHLQATLRCGNTRPADRAALLGVSYDLVLDPTINLRAVLDSLDGVILEAETDQLLDFAADALAVLVAEASVREPVVTLASELLRRPDVAIVWPALQDLVDAGVVEELLGGVAELLKGCGRGTP